MRFHPRIIVAALLASVLIALPAAAMPIGDAADGFGFELAPAGAITCVGFPKSQTVAADCEGVDLDAMLRELSSKGNLRFFAVVRHDDFGYMLVYTQTKGFGDPDERSAGEFVRGFMKQSAQTGERIRFVDPSKPFRIEQLGAAKAIRLDWLIEQDPMIRSIGFAIAGETKLHTVVASGPASHETQIVADVETALRAMHVKPARSRAYERGRAVGKLIGALVLLAALAAIVVLIVKRARRRAGK